MHVGIATGFANLNQVDDARFLREEFVQLELAAELGFDSLWMTEHHFSRYSMSPNPLMYLSYLAGRTRARLGTQVLVAPWHDPLRLAEDIALLDHVSRGRAIIGFGRGLSLMEFEGLRADPAQARERFDETVGLVMSAFETGVLEGGETRRQPRRELRPAPLRSLQGRAFCAAGSSASVASAARLGLGRLFLGQSQLGAQAGTESPMGRITFEDSQDAWLGAWKRAHPQVPPPAPFVSYFVFIDESGERARELARDHMSRTYAAAIQHYDLTGAHHGTIRGYESYGTVRMTPEQAKAAIENAHRNAIAGTPREVLEQLDQVKRVRQPQGMMPHLWTGGMSHDECVRAIRLFAQDCLEEMQSWESAPSTIDGPLQP
jgi:alkanesulfonate monooxygenase SsuD/methylene tetrahydromethanopterin reductase-like flavin-dependent oxidoreductase (luciferase family)